MKAFSVEDLRLHHKVMELHGHTHTKNVFGTVRSVKLDADGYQSRIWRFPGDGACPTSFTDGPGNDISPRLSPFGKVLAFISDRGQSRQIHLMALDGGESRQIGYFQQGVSAFRWASDGKTLFVAAPQAVNPDARKGGDASSHVARNDRAPEVCWKLPYKSDGIGYLLVRQIHLYAMDVATGEATQLTQGEFDVLGFAPSPNGKHVAYVRTRDGKFAHCSDLWVCDVDGGRHRRLTNNFATVSQPAWSNDGSHMVFAGAVKEGDGESRLWFLEYSSGESRCLHDELEVADAENIFWSDDSRSLILIRAWRGRHQAIRLDINSAEVNVLIEGDQQFSAFTHCGSGYAYAVDTPTRASEVYMNVDGKERQVGRLNVWWNERIPIEMISRSFEVPDGKGGQETIEGWLLREKKSKGPQPLLVDVHGGPASYALLDYDTNVYWQVLCSRGWSVLMLNAVGSSSFGTEFCSRLGGSWGEMDFPQYQAAIKALQEEGHCDERIAIVGKSYGGYFTSWAISHTDMFKAAVVMAPVGNIETHYGTSDGGYYADPFYMRTAPAFDRQKARNLSPLQFIEKTKTPTLFLQGKEDERCPKCQSEELFVSLYNAGDTPCELVLYPHEGHAFLGEGQPACREDAAQRIIDWVLAVVEAPKRCGI